MFSAPLQLKSSFQNVINCQKAVGIDVELLKIQRVIFRTWDHKFSTISNDFKTVKSLRFSHSKCCIISDKKKSFYDKSKYQAYCATSHEYLIVGLASFGAHTFTSMHSRISPCTLDRYILMLVAGRQALHTLER